MKIKGLVLLLLVLAILATGAMGCEETPPKSIADIVADIFPDTLEASTTVGNRAYLPLNMSGKPSEHVPEILGVLDAFEKTYFVEIIDWKIERDQDAHGASAYIYGLWVDHRPKN